MTVRKNLASLWDAISFWELFPVVRRSAATTGYFLMSLREELQNSA